MDSLLYDKPHMLQDSINCHFSSYAEKSVFAPHNSWLLPELALNLNIC